MSNPGDLSLADRLDRIESKIDRLVDQIADLRTAQAVMRVKYSLLGGAGSAVLALVAKLMGVV